MSWKTDNIVFSLVCEIIGFKFWQIVKIVELSLWRTKVYLVTFIKLNWTL